MSHPQQQSYVESVTRLYPDSFINKKVLEVGSLDLNGSVRRFFKECEYIGSDVGEGVGVDVVCEGQKYDAPDNTFDTSISCECFEHNPFWKETFLNMIRMTKPNGIVVMTCATTGRAPHGITSDGPEHSPLTVKIGWEYYQNLTEQDFSCFDLDSLFSTYKFSIGKEMNDLYFYGVKK